MDFRRTRTGGRRIFLHLTRFARRAKVQIFARRKKRRRRVSTAASWGAARPSSKDKSGHPLSPGRRLPPSSPDGKSRSSSRKAGLDTFPFSFSGSASRKMTRLGFL